MLSLLDVELQIDEAGLIVKIKIILMLMTLADWNNNVNTNVYYDSEKKKMEKEFNI